jgi:hypothetical protein
MEFLFSESVTYNVCNEENSGGHGRVRKEVFHSIANKVTTHANFLDQRFAQTCNCPNTRSGKHL